MATTARRKKKKKRAYVSVRFSGAPWGDMMQSVDVTMPSSIFVEISREDPKKIQTIEILIDKHGITIGGPR